MTDYHEYIGETVEVVDKDNDIIKGTIIGYDVGAVEDLDYDSIDIQLDNGCYISVPIPDIQNLYVVKSNL